jgi:uncharacterized membrane protein YoaK (UPF0700 family)
MTPLARLSLATGSVLMLATGFVDAYTFLQHGHVFAQAMTGNLVLIAIGAFEPSIVAFWRPLVPYAAFTVGVAVVWGWSRRRGTPAPQLATLGLLAGVLVVVGFLPAGTLSVVVTAVIAFAAGMQIAAFRDVGRAAFTTTVMTTNSMKAVNTALTALASADADDRAVARAYATALAGFVAGAFLGAFLTTWWGERAAWVDAALFAVAAGLYVAERRTA